MKVKKYFPVTLKIDGEEIKIRIKRMNLEESGGFSRGLMKVGSPTWERFISRAATGPEQERKSDGFFKIPMEALKDEKLLELSEERRAEYEAADEKHEQESRTFLVWVFETFVTVESGLVEDGADGIEQMVTKGIDFLEWFGARFDVINDVLAAVREENALDAEQKKELKSRTASAPSLPELATDLAGPKPAPIVENAAISDSVETVDATSLQAAPSGLMKVSRRTPAPSSI